MNKGIHTVYKATSPSGKVYIGYTSQKLEQRWSKHIYDSKRGLDHYFYRAMRKHGHDSFSIEAIYQSLDRKDALEKESYFISCYRSYVPSIGYNGTMGGDVGFPTAETKIRMSKAHSEESRKRMSEAQRGERSHLYGKPRDEDTKNKISEALKGRVHTEEARQNMSKAQKGRIVSEEARKKMSDSQKGISKTKVDCPHCGKVGGKPAMNRYHFDKCKQRQN